ncbi:hypothetical protein D3C71_235140 [compost metagenome]
MKHSNWFTKPYAFALLECFIGDVRRTYPLAHSTDVCLQETHPVELQIRCVSCKQEVGDSHTHVSSNYNELPPASYETPALTVGLGAGNADASYEGGT